MDDANPTRARTYRQLVRTASGAVAGAAFTSYLAALGLQSGSADEVNFWPYPWLSYLAGLFVIAVLVFVIFSVLGDPNSLEDKLGLRDRPAQRLRRGEAARYLARLASSLSRDLHEFVPLDTRLDGEKIDAVKLETLLRTEDVVLLLGRSGVGKSHLARHAMLRAVESGRVVVWLSFDEYELGGLGKLLQQAVTRHARVSALALLRTGAESYRPIIVLDEVNGGPAPLQTPIFNELEDLRRRLPFSLLVTSTEQPKGIRPHLEVTFDELDFASAAALRSSYGIDPNATTAEAFTTPFEISIAADCLGDLPHEASTTDLLDTFVGRRVESEGVRSGLREIARLMDRDIRSSLDMRDVRATLRRSEKTPPDAVGLVVANDLLVHRQGRLRFRHEQFERFFIAEDLVAESAGGAELGTSLAEANHRDLAAHALTLERDDRRRLAALLALEDPHMLADAATGIFGNQTKEYVYREVLQAISTAARTVSHASFSPEAEPPGWAMGAEQARLDSVLLRTAGILVTRGMCVTECCALIDATDHQIAAEVERLRDNGVDSPVSLVTTSSYGQPWSDDAKALGASILTRSIGKELMMMWGRSLEGVAAQVLRKSGVSTWGRLYIAALLYKHLDVSSNDLAQLPSLLRVAWASQSSLLRMESLFAVHHSERQLNGEPRQQVLEILSGLESKNIFLSSQIVETLARYGEVHSGRTVDQILEEIRGVLTGEFPQQQSDMAMGIFSSMFEPSELVGPYFEAVEELTSDERLHLHVLAATADHHGMNIDWVMSEIADTVGESDVAAIEVLRRYVDDPSPESIFPQSSTAAHLHALRGWSVVATTFPARKEAPATDHGRAWYFIDRLLFRQLRSETLTDSDDDDWTHLLDLPVATISVLEEIHNATGTFTEWNPHRCLLDAFPGHMRKLMEWGALHLDRVRDEHVLPFGPPDRHIVWVLGLIGSQESSDKLRAIAGDERLDSQIIAAIRQIDARNS